MLQKERKKERKKLWHESYKKKVGISLDEKNEKIE